MSTSQGTAVSSGSRGRPRRVSIIFVGVLLFCGIGGAYLWYRGLGTRVVCVATGDLSAYEQITSADVRRVEVPSEDVPSHVTEDTSAVLGRYTLAAVQHGRPLRLDQLGPKLPPGTLAKQEVASLGVPSSDIVGGTATRGDRVDILLSSMAESGPRNAILRRAVVLDVKPENGQSADSVIVCAFPASDEQALLTAGGTAHIFIVRISVNGPP